MEKPVVKMSILIDKTYDNNIFFYASKEIAAQMADFGSVLTLESNKHWLVADKRFDIDEVAEYLKSLA